jgi:uncharacterized protein YbaR (Trm112 family)
MTVWEQIRRGIVVCPATREPLFFKDETSLATAAGSNSHNMASTTFVVARKE